ncbi:MAG: BspA family leucine-rich repeat surface protein [Candidatus Nanosynbacter sp.]|nr:BspA family leucine-rich repeat surface protein [Candidatus Nanosynbacter sp.]
MGGGWFNRELKIFVLFLSLISFSNLIFSNNTFALYTPTLSASVDQTNLQVNGNQVINSAHKTTEIPLSLTVNTNNKTGYTATLNSETDETALVNNDSANGAKINSISSTSILSSFLNNTWGYKFGTTSTNYLPIPALSAPAQILQTTGKTNGNESNQLSIGMKLADNLESGNYTNKLILSFVSNPYQMHAIMTKGPVFNTELKALETATNKIERFKKSTVAPAASMNTINIEDEESDYEIKLWLNPVDKTAYYYAEPEKVYLNADSSKMFCSEFGTQNIRNILEIDLFNFDTSQVMNMSYMFSGMSNLTTLNVSNFDTSKVINMDSMFRFMSSLTMLNVSNFDTSKVTDMYAMFHFMTNLTTLNLSNFDTSKVTNMGGMFSGVSSLTTLNLSNFDTSKVTDMGAMFFNMPNLTTLDLSNFDTSQVTDMEYIFSIYSEDRPKDKLEKIYVNNDFNTSKLTKYSYMFEDRKKLRGGNGSYLTNPFLADKTWLRIDDPANGRPGYFTRKP